MSDTVQPAPRGAVVRELQRMLAALQYFTRVPVPAWVGHGQALLDDAARYFPAVGLLVGGTGALVLVGTGRLWPMPVAVVLSLVATMLVTGAFHEDGLADSADGLGGGLSRSRALEIMKDSRIGVFGAAALALVLLLKFAMLSSLPIEAAAMAMIAGHVVSRLGAVLIMATLGYVRDTPDSRSKPLVQRVSGLSVVVGGITGALAVAPLGARGAVAAFVVLVVCLAWRQYLKRRLDGYTGDCLGAAQQLGECSFYLVCTAGW
jgi:adenosylcobinamide-GDP ribazoletransferase